MNFHIRTTVLICCLLGVAILATTLVLAGNSRQSLLAQQTDDALMVADRIAHVIEFGAEVPDDVDAAIGEQMVTQAELAARLVAIAEQSGMSTEEITRHLQEVCRNTTADEFWVTDETGRAYIHTLPNVDFRFGPDPKKQPQASKFWPLLTGEKERVIQETRKREIDDQAFKYVAVDGVDRPRIVQVGSPAALMESLREQMGLTRLVQQIAGNGSFLSLRVVDKDLKTLAYRGREAGEAPKLGEEEAACLVRAIRERRPVACQMDSALQVAAPVADGENVIWGAAVLELSTAHTQAAVSQQWRIAGLVAALVLLFGIAGSWYLARRVTDPVSRLTEAAEALERGAYDPAILEPIAARDDELGRLARVFQQSATEVKARETRLQQEVEELKIEIDQSRKERQVAEIVESDYFKDLQRKVQALRARPSEAAG